MAKTLLVCVNSITGHNKPCCAGRGSVALAEALEAGIRDRKIDVAVSRINCLNKCHFGPSLRLAPGGPFRLGDAAADVDGVLDWLTDACGFRNNADTVEFDGFYPGS